MESLVEDGTRRPISGFWASPTISQLARSPPVIRKQILCFLSAMKTSGADAGGKVDTGSGSPLGYATEARRFKDPELIHPIIFEEPRMWIFILLSVKAVIDGVGIATLGRPAEPLKVPAKSIRGGRP